MLNFKKIICCAVALIAALGILAACTTDTITTTTTTTNPDTTTTTTNNGTTTTTGNNSTTTTTAATIASTTTSTLGDYEVYGEAIRYDIDGDGHEEFCRIEAISSKSAEGLFRIIVLGYETDNAPKYYGIFRYEKWHNQSFAKTADGKAGLIHTHYDPEITDVTFWDMSIENGRIVFKENGKAITPYNYDLLNTYWEESPDFLECFYFDNDNTNFVELDGGGQKEIVTLGYLQYAEDETEKPKTYWIIGITDLDNPEMSRHFGLGAHKELSFDITEHTAENGHTYNSVYIEELGSPQYLCSVLCMDEGFGASYWLTQAIR